MTKRVLSDGALKTLQQILDAPEGRRIGVLGLGVVGRALALHLAGRGAQVLGADLRVDLERSDLETSGVVLHLGDTDAQTFDSVEALVISPGVDPTQAAVSSVVDRGIPVCGELEVAGPLRAKIAAVTGTNGKSTTTALLGALCTAAGFETFVGGNLGDPVIAWLDRKTATDIAVLELSSFQLETAYSFRPDVAIVLNVTPDHVDRYPNVAEYAQTKRRLVENLPPEGVAVLNHDDPTVAAMASYIRGRIFWFSTTSESIPGDGATLTGDRFVPHGTLETLGEIDLVHPQLLGRHNRENALAAILAAYALDPQRFEAASLSKGYQEFAGLEHRLEVVGEVDGVRFINDSKATNDDAAAIALQAMTGPVLLLAGGRGKGAGYSRLVAEAAGKVIFVILFGEDADALQVAFKDHPKVVRRERMRDAFDTAASEASSGDTVLLAPACSSFDEFKNYAERGRAFKQMVAELKEVA